MSFRFQRKETADEGVRRIAREQIDAMLTQIDDPQVDRNQVVHNVRKSCKKLRGLLRLVRPELKGKHIFARENSWYADAARSLSTMRDSQVVIESFDSLLSNYASLVDASMFDSVRQQLVARRDTLTGEGDQIDDRIEVFRQLMVRGRKRIDKWKLNTNGFAALDDGLQKTYARARLAMKAAYKEISTENFHEMRKRAKYHWYHCKLLRPIWPEEMVTRAHLAKKISDYLGDDHDLAVLTEIAAGEPVSFGSSDCLEVLATLVQCRRHELQAQAHLAGKRLLAEKPNVLSKRLEVYWKAWQKQPKAKAPQIAAATLKLVAG